ncbi:MAG: hypothetical protein U1D29_14180 [Burkholderiales bacterium]|nr:hypothetical protein [Burkholderiales bacterium]
MLQRTWARALGGVLALATATLLVLAFHGVVIGIMRQGELRRANDAQHDMAVWRCRSMGGKSAREVCLLQLALKAPDAMQASHPGVLLTVALVPAGL